MVSLSEMIVKTIFVQKLRKYNRGITHFYKVLSKAYFLLNKPMNHNKMIVFLL